MSAKRTRTSAFPHRFSEKTWRHLALFVVIAAVSLASTGCQSPASSAGQSAIEPQVQAYFAAKERQARKLAELERKEMAPEVWPYFAAAAKGDWRRVESLYFQMAKRCYQFEEAQPDSQLYTMVWQTITETYRAHEQVAKGESKYVLAFGQQVLESLPPGSILFAGTDASRFVIPFLSKPSESGDPVFVVMPSALTDGLYLNYLRTMYGGQIATPTAEDSQQALGQYLADAKFRLETGRLLPGEHVTLVNGKVQVRGQVAVMGMNASVARIMFEQNPEREFFLDEGFPLERANPHLVPHGLIFKFNREPLTTLPEEVVKRDADYWSRQVSSLLGDWMQTNTSIKEICEFAERVYLRKNLSGFQGDPRYVQSARTWKSSSAFADACALYASRRAAIGRVYAWRAKYAKTIEEHHRMKREADFALRQAVALCPYSPEAVYRLVILLVEDKRQADALLVAQLADKCWPGHPDFAKLVKQLKPLP